MIELHNFGTRRSLAWGPGGVYSPRLCDRPSRSSGLLALVTPVSTKTLCNHELPAIAHLPVGPRHQQGMLKGGRRSLV